MNLLQQYLAQSQPGLLGMMGQTQQPQFQASPAPQPPMPQTPQIQPIAPLMPGQPTSMPALPGGVGPGLQQPTGGGGMSGFGGTMMNGMFGPAGSAAAPAAAGSGLGPMIAKSLLAMFL